MNSFAVFWCAFLTAAIAAKPILALLRRMKSRQTVSEFAPETHQVKQGTPTMGGIIILVGLFVGLAVSLPSARGETRALGISAMLLAILFGTIGFVDDYVVPRMVKGKRGLGWRQKILMQVVAAAIGLLPLLGSQPAALAGGVFVVLFVSNAYNFSDGLDGLAGSIGLAYAAGLLGLGAISGSTALWPIALSLSGGLLVFLVVNAHPAKVFMGDVGSLPIGAVLGLASIYPVLEVSRLQGTIGLGPPILAVIVLNTMMAVELVPVPLQVLSYKLRKKRIFPCTPVHHAFEKAGWPETRVVVLFAVGQTLASILAVSIVAWAVGIR